MTKQEKIKKWLDESGAQYLSADGSKRIIYKIDHSGFIYSTTQHESRPIGIVDAEAKTFLPCPDFTDDIEAPVALPRQERGKRFDPKQFLPDDSRNVLLRVSVGDQLVGYATTQDGEFFRFLVICPTGAHISLKDSYYRDHDFTWEEL